MKKALFLLLMIASLAQYSCQKTKTTTVSGVVFDQNHQPLPGVRVIAGNKIGESDDNGCFLLEQIVVDGDRPLVKFQKQGYFSLVRTSSSSDEINQLKVILKIKETNASSNTVACELPAGLSIEPGKGCRVTFSEKINPKRDIFAAVTYINTTDIGQIAALPGGDMKTYNANGQSKHRSYGVIAVELSNNEGKSVQLPSSAYATLQIPVPESMLDKLTENPSLFYFEGFSGLWHEEGTAKIENGAITGIVRHFTYWSFGEKTDALAFIKGRVTDRNGRGIAGTEVIADQCPVITDQDGNYKAAVTADSEFDVELNYMGFRIKAAGMPVKAGQIGIMDLSVPPMTYISGTIIGCNGKASAAQVNLSWGSPDFSQVYTRNGVFELSIPGAIDESVLTITCNDSKLRQKVKNSGKKSSIALGNLVVCQPDKDKKNRKDEHPPLPPVRNDSTKNTALDSVADSAKVVPPENGILDDIPSTSVTYLVLNGGSFRNQRIEFDGKCEARRIVHTVKGQTETIFDVEAASNSSVGITWYLSVHEFKTGTFHVDYVNKIKVPAGVQIYTGVKLPDTEISFTDMEIKISALGEPGQMVTGTVILKGGNYRDKKSNTQVSGLTAVGEFSIKRIPDFIANIN